MEHKLHTDTLAVFELSSRICSGRNMNLIDPEVVLQQFGTIEKLQHKLRFSSQDNQRLSELNNRLKRQIGNYEQILYENKSTIHQLVSDLAAANAKNECLTAELEQHRHIFELAQDELKNVTVRKSTLLRDNNDDVFLSGDRTVQNIFNHHKNGEKNRSKRRSSSHHMILSDKRSRLAFNRQHAKFVNRCRLQSVKNVADPRSVLRHLPHASSGGGTGTATTATTTTLVPRYATASFHLRAGLVPNQQTDRLPGFGPGWARGRPINTCDHQFVEERAFGKMLQNCKMCENRLGLSFHRCKDCKLCVHFNCRFLAPLPCVPFVVPPPKSTGAQKFRLADFCPATNPKVPAQLIRCVYAIESDEKNGIAVYEHEKPAWSDPTILALFDDFEKLRSATVLKGLNARTLTGFIKSFLQELKEPLIPISSYNEFLQAAQRNDQRLLRDAVDDLFPLPNRDTLAYLCLHWQQMISREHRAVYANADHSLPKHSEDVLRAAQQENVQIPPEELEKVIIMEQLLKFGEWSQILVHCCTAEMPSKLVPMPLTAAAAEVPQMPITQHNDHHYHQSSGAKASAISSSNNGTTNTSAFSADSSMLGPVTWTPSTEQQKREQRSILINHVTRTAAAPFFDRPY
ncbi:hypothetical protein niasHS_013722 [Heterodera schachtii]|uniref:Phorbol-ester/DAG-type domain-containing protein n=1 Tax=Heterodera schachtii TaxID=97005 RepID=A0ABD2IWE6_HETSC